MVRRPLALLGLGAPLLLFACRSATVSVAYAPAIGQRYAFRYEIEATVTRRIAGAAPQVTRVDTQLIAQEQVRSRSPAGTRLLVVLTRDGGTPRTAEVLVDRAGSLAAIELVGGLDAASLGVADTGSLAPNQGLAPPDRRLAPGDRWTISGSGRTGHGWLAQLGVVDGQDVAVVDTSVSESVDDALQADSRATQVTGAIASVATTSYDLAGGAVRRSHSHSSGTLHALLSPPSGVAARAVQATIDYDVTVQVTRTS
jgi:hypothetical protein